jgi:stage II sporulation protein D
LIAALALAGCAGSQKERPEPAPTGTSTTGAPTPRTQGAAPTPPTGAAPAAGATANDPLAVSPAWRSARSIRVGLVAGASRMLIGGSKDWTLTLQGGRELARGPEVVRLRITRSLGGEMAMYREEETSPMWTGAGAETLLFVSHNGFVGWSGNWYRGTFRVFGSQTGGLTLVNDVDLENYLRSVLPHEIGVPPESDFEAVKAQAVAARSYTLSYIGRRAALGFDLWATVEDQVYGGSTRENPQSDRALNQTRGELLLSDGVPIRALYSSACGGRTSNVEDVWPWPWTPYLRSVRDAAGPESPAYCQISSNYRWREEWTAVDFMESLREYGALEGGGSSMLSGDLVDVRVKSRSRCGRVEEVAVTTTKGDWVIRGDRTRWGIRRPGGKGAILRSSFFKIGVVRGREGEPLRVIATGAGNGHGIGLCQWGAMGMARAGAGYKTILRHYYKGAVLSKVS